MYLTKKFSNYRKPPFPLGKLNFSLNTKRQKLYTICQYV